MPPLVGVQLYTLRDACANDFLATLRSVRQLGYRHVEAFRGLFGAASDEVQTLIDEIGLSIPAAHLPLESLETELDQAVDLWGPLGVRTLVCPWVDEETRSGDDAWPRLGERLQRVGERLHAQGLALAYHNHDFEFRAGDGLEALMAATRPEHVGLEIDVYWLAHAGGDPAEYIRRHAERVRLIHLKDGHHDPLAFTPLGEGEIDLGAAVAAALEAGVEAFFVEQDESDGDPFEALRRSARALPALGLAQEPA